SSRVIDHWHIVIYAYHETRVQLSEHRSCSVRAGTLMIVELIFLGDSEILPRILSTFKSNMSKLLDIDIFSSKCMLVVYLCLHLWVQSGFCQHNPQRPDLHAYKLILITSSTYLI